MASDRAAVENAKPLLQSVSVPWQVSPSTSFLRLAASEDGCATVTFVAHYKCEQPNEAANGESIEIVTAPREFEPSDGSARGPFRLVRVTFTNGLWVRMLPAFSDTEVIEETAFDWSQVDGAMKAGEDITNFLQRVQDTWIDSGVCPNPGMYEIERSTWLDELNIGENLNQPWRHYIVVGNDSYVEVIASEWQWEEGQVMDGWR